MIVPWPPGGVVDIVARVVTRRLQIGFGQPFVIENKTGAGGMIGAGEVARAQPDGYVLAFTSSALTMNGAMAQKTAFDPVRSFQPVGIAAWAPSILVAHPSRNLKSVADLLALARAKPGLTYASAGNGSPAHFAAEMFRSQTGIDILHVPYKGAPAAMTDQVAGRVDFHFANAAVALPQAKAGTVSALAITSARRSPQLPEVLTMAEQGFRDFHGSQWLGLLAPAGTPQSTVARLHAILAKTMADPAVQEGLAKYAIDAELLSTPASFSAFLQADLERWSGVVRAAKITPN